MFGLKKMKNKKHVIFLIIKHKNTLLNGFFVFSNTRQANEEETEKHRHPSKTIEMQSKFDTFDMNFPDANGSHV